MGQLVLEFALACEPRESGITGNALNGCGRHRTAAIELARRRTRDARQRVETGPDDELRPWPGAVARATGTLPAELDQCIVLPLTMAALVVLDRLHKCLQRGPDRRATFGIEQPVDPDHAILRLAQMQIAPLAGASSLHDRA